MQVAPISSNTAVASKCIVLSHTPFFESFKHLADIIMDKTLPFPSHAVLYVDTVSFLQRQSHWHIAHPSNQKTSKCFFSPLISQRLPVEQSRETPRCKQLPKLPLSIKSFYPCACQFLSFVFACCPCYSWHLFLPNLCDTRRWFSQT